MCLLQVGEGVVLPIKKEWKKTLRGATDEFVFKYKANKDEEYLKQYEGLLVPGENRAKIRNSSDSAAVQ